MVVNWIATVLLVPPFNLALLAAVAFCLMRRHTSRVVLGIAIAGLIVFALPIVGDSLIAALERRADAQATELSGTLQPGSVKPGAIVVLGAEVRLIQPSLTGEAASADIGPLSLERARTAAALYRRTGLPMLVSGGVVGDEPVAVGATMAQSLAQDFAAPPRWVETHSRDTWENARFSAEILRAAGITKVYLVTHAWHMPRAVLAFRRAGITAVPAPVRLDAWPPLGWRRFVPGASAWQVSYFGCHEWIGLAFYSLR